MITSGAGFTLIELLVALAIIGVLVSSLLLVLNPLEQFKKSRDVQRKNDLEQMKIALDIYYNNNNLYPLGSGIIQGTSWGSSWQPYMVKLPKDPLDTQSYCYESDGSLYRLSAKLERSSDPQATPEIICAGDSYNYAVTSTNTSVIVYGSPTPTPFPLPTSTPMPTSILTSTPVPTSISTPTPTPILPTPTSVGTDWIAIHTFLDSNRNSVQDAGEGNLSAEQLNLRNLAFTFTRTGLTDFSGNYTFFSLPVDSYVIGINATPTHVGTSLGFNIPAGWTYNWGLIPPLYAITATVYVDTNWNAVQDIGESGYSAGATVSISAPGSPSSATTNSSGQYIWNVPAGIYTINLTAPAGYFVTTLSWFTVSPIASGNFGIALIPTPTPTPAYGWSAPFSANQANATNLQSACASAGFISYSNDFLQCYSRNTPCNALSGCNANIGYVGGCWRTISGPPLPLGCNSSPCAWMAYCSK